MTTKSVTRYVVTIVDKTGTRTLAFAAQGRNTYATPELAQAWIEACKANNHPESLKRFFAYPESLEVRPVECYPGHFDPMTRYF